MNFIYEFVYFVLNKFYQLIGVLEYRTCTNQECRQVYAFWNVISVERMKAMRRFYCPTCFTKKRIEIQNRVKAHNQAQGHRSNN